MRALSTAASGTRRVFGAAFEATLILLVIAALAFAFAMVNGRAPSTGSVFAKGGADIWIASSSLTTSDSALHFTDSVSFGYQSDKSQSIQLQCFQPGSSNMVFSATEQVSGTSGISDPLALGPSPAWTGGAASCQALLGYRANSGKYTVVAKVAFDVAP
jgi:hypothetical protein